MRVFHVQIHRVEHLPDGLRSHHGSVDVELSGLVPENAPSHRQTLAVFVSRRPTSPVLHAELDSNRSVSDACCPVLVDKLGQGVFDSKLNRVRCTS